ncbi:SigB/SigF/SigG family RNA polymerase sigma factor [Streptomyces sp. Je 1-369]|uniref:SigB/SigF/SigG family RNA polymerase sigma factor n=1 Tax=Streptomyces sp. Je 1-369 TaxID=2966192 RepID=UPI002285AB32|nr:SigB/SigF/SigG family RNA polymerase sigma factor [Streptomyces sp. Je 1-369]WAL93152.1 SigB/SigF/SigG family RNA polymerase sigma factor [Streptomyces sp. Je 1-369]
MPSRRTHDDAPDTEQTFRHLATTPPGRERDALVAELVEAWLPLARRLAGRFRHKGESMDDLKQVAALGLLKAVERYDPDRGAFPSYAVPMVTGELHRHFRDHSWDVHVPRRVQELRNKVRSTHQDLMNRPDHPAEPDLEEIAAQAGLTLAEVHNGMEAWDSNNSLSLDADIGTAPHGDSFTLADTLGHTDPGYDLATDREAARRGLAQLTERERSILYLRFFEDMPQSRIAEEIGVSQMHISRLITRSCAQVREHTQADPRPRQAA